MLQCPHFTSEMDFERVLSNGYNVYVIEKYVFVLTRCVKDTSYVRCRNNLRRGCKARAKILNGEFSPRYDFIGFCFLTCYSIVSLVTLSTS